MAGGAAVTGLVVLSDTSTHTPAGLWPCYRGALSSGEWSMAGKQCTLWNDLPGLPEESWPGLGPRRRPRWAPRTLWWPSPSSEHCSLSPRGFLVRPEDGRNDREQPEPQCHRAPYQGNSQEAQHLRRALWASRGQLGLQPCEAKVLRA